MEKIRKPGFMLVGLQLKDKTTNKDNRSSVDCGNLWQQFENDKIFDLVPNKLSDEIYAVYYDYDKDETEAFSYFIGCKVAEGSDYPKHLSSLKIPGQTYHKITVRGVMTGCITDAWIKIWNSDLKRKFGYDFEVYDERSQDWNDAELDIYLSTFG
ncbi:GyrI-like domain-containing protein [Pseudozobellia thermophila]|uniref:Predicted transcriptional regulator YdeE, contains AraC-type DNA-binding domain n=1 Tax=Pseudozobellia thermophila TaxID=192903 RepID=A0A1M6L611_9FLAO|nr:GyrI-like domain-containing protein [Pseudozobellia thermophila]SHJ66663.1 Predicted transcriptional regulator YdeE, contains AraC-type DNA-binding domain [Pseudozobellia thermophila]